MSQIKHIKIFHTKTSKNKISPINKMLSLDEVKLAIRQQNPNLSTKTISNYSTYFLRLYEELGNRRIRVVNSVLKSDFMKDKATSTRALYLYSLITALPALKMVSERQLDAFYETYEKLQNKLIRERKTKKVIIPEIKPKDIIGDLDKKIKNETDPIRKERLLQDKLVALIYTRIAPRRSEDYYKMKLTTEPLKKAKELSDSANQYNGRNFIFKNYKTAKIYGMVSMLVPVKIRNVIRDMLKLRDEIDFNTEYLFANRNEEPYDHTGWSHLVKRVLGLSVVQLRKRQVAETLDNKEVQDAIKLAGLMGHKVSTQQEHYAPRNEPEDTD